MLVGVALFLTGFVVDCFFFFFFDVSGGLLMTVVMVVVLFSVFCFAMDCGCHGGGGGVVAALLWMLFIGLDILFYCVVYIILIYSKYYFNV